jgi:hypothetical protein
MAIHLDAMMPPHSRITIALIIRISCVKRQRGILLFYYRQELR